MRKGVFLHRQLDIRSYKERRKKCYNGERRREICFSSSAVKAVVWITHSLWWNFWRNSDISVRCKLKRIPCRRHHHHHQTIIAPSVSQIVNLNADYDDDDGGGGGGWAWSRSRQSSRQKCKPESSIAKVSAWVSGEKSVIRSLSYIVCGIVLTDQVKSEKNNHSKVFHLDKCVVCYTWA